MKLLIDMNLSPRWVHLLKDNGFETLHWSTVGNATASDSEIMAWASDNRYVVLTNDLDFSAILAATQEITPSVVQIRAEDVSPDLIGDKIVHALRQMQPDLETGALMSIDDKTMRIRILPLLKQRENP
ncbi:MAG: DUF5615 family PIN-like protein [Thermoclostridium sp.]|nr:DUF5615 family PIN-like protein [Thermoclostridium sp.]